MLKRAIVPALKFALIFLAINLLAAHLASDCGLPAVFGRDGCADDIARAGWPMQFYEEGGFAYHRDVNFLFLLINVGIGAAFALLTGWLFLHNKTLSK